MTDSPADDSAPAVFAFLERRRQARQGEGMSRGHASAMAMLDYRVSLWPAEWGNRLKIIVYGDFIQPTERLEFADLSIVVHPEPVTNSIVSSAMCVLRADVDVQARTVDALNDACERIGTLLGVLAACDWGQATVGWWCHVTHGTWGGAGSPLQQLPIAAGVRGLRGLPTAARRRVSAALYWIREPRLLMRERFRSDVLRVYAGYWNAFECLVEAISELQPPPRSSRPAKQALLDELVAAHSGRWTPEDVQDCYRIVNPGFVSKASHAMRVCFGDQLAEAYINECFRATPSSDRLYDIRNSINHGDIEAEHLTELLRVESKKERLWFIVFGMLGRLIPVNFPIDRDAANVTRRSDDGQQ
jgi:hypothetical protein